MARALMVDDKPTPSDVIVIPSGHIFARLPAGAQLLHAGYSHSIFTAVNGDFDRSLLLMNMRVTETELLWKLVDRERIPRDAVTIASGVTSTYQDARAFRDYAVSYHLRSAILLTSHLHSRRARWTFRRQLNGLQIRLTTMEAPQSDFDVDRWWQNEDGLLTVANEYLKFGFYLTHY